MALTTASLRLVKTPERSRRKSFLRLITYVLIVLSFPLLAGCADDGASGDAALAGANGNKKATISLSPLKVAFSVSQGGSNPPGQAVAISNSGAGKLSWSVSADAPWLALSPNSGTGAGSFTATAIIAGLAAGTYSGNITVAATGATNTPQSIPVSLTVSASTSITTTSSISLSPTSLIFSATQGGSNPSEQAVAISNSGTGTLSWSVSTDVPWLSLSPTSGTAPNSFTATAIIAGLATGTYSGNITVTATGATNTPQTVPVSLTVSASTSTTTPTTTSASLSWDPVTDPTVVGFFVHYGTQSPNSSGSCAYAQGTYSPLFSMTASSPTVTISNLATGTTYYFAVSSYNGSIEGACSNEVFKAT